MNTDETVSKHFLEPEDTFADYTILQYCGRGACGEVYLAEDISHKTVALKIIPIAGYGDIWRMELIALRHYRQSIDDYRSLIEIYHVGETEDFFFYTMEPADNLLHGQEDEDRYIADTLSHRLEYGGRMAPENVLTLADTLLDALEELASHELVHRDIKPGNIIFVNGAAKLSDIGLISASGVRAKLVGTANYLPPELADGDLVGSSNDLYALGKVLYCALTGLTPEHFPEVPASVPLPAWLAMRPVLLKACHDDPRQRFFTPGEFRAALPHAIREPNIFDRMADVLRGYRSRHPVWWRDGSIVAALLAAGGIGLGLITCEYKVELRRQKREQLNFIFRTIDDLNNRAVLWKRLAQSSGKNSRFRQLEIVSGLAGAARAADDMLATERFCRQANSILRAWAEEELGELLERLPPEQAEENNSPEALFALLAEYSDFRELPYFASLPDTLQKQFLKTENLLRTRLRALCQGPLPGRNWNCLPDAMPFVYIARGRLADEPPQPYWIAANEFTRLEHRLSLGLAAAKPEPDDQLPLTGLSWNDWLEICRRLTRQAQERNLLPKGYIYRPPYTDEWSFVYHSGWRNGGTPRTAHQALAQIAWFGPNSRYSLHAVRRKQPDVFGLYDLIGNADELVLPRVRTADAPVRLGHYGGSFRDWRPVAEPECRLDPDLPATPFSGARLVLGPGSMEYFERLWYTGSVFALEENGRRWELLGHPTARWDGQSARQWAELLGGRLAELPSPRQREKIFQAFPRLEQMACLIGGERRSDAWYWLQGGKVNNGDWLRDSADEHSGRKSRLLWDRNFWNILPHDATAPSILVEWREEQWRRRLGELPPGLAGSPLLLHEFQHADRRYLLLRAPVDWYTARRLAELLGGELAAPDDAEVLTKVRQMPEQYRSLRVALGGYRRYGRWIYLDGRPGPAELPADRPDRNLSLNQCFMAFYQGELCNTERFDALLCVVPPPGSAEKPQSP